MSMQQNTISDISIQDIIRTGLSDETDIVAVYLFGSAAQGKAHQLSDIDVAILFVDTLSLDDVFSRTIAIGTHLESLFSVPIDVVALNRAPIFLRFQVIRSGELLLERDRTQRCIFHMRTMNAYFDFKPFLEYQRNEMVRRISEKGLGHGYRGHRDALAEVRELRETLASASARVAD